MGYPSFVLFIAFVSSAAFGVPSEAEMAKVFKRHHKERYVPRQCHDNILDFATSLRDREGLYMVTIENKGFSTFGMVNAEVARDQHMGQPETREKNWFHHVILMDRRGLVYDFDYTEKPSIVKMADYLETMYLDEPECKSPQPGEFCGGRDAKLDGYEIISYKIEDALNGKELPVEKTTLRKVLKDWRVLLGTP